MFLAEPPPKRTLALFKLVTSEPRCSFFCRGPNSSFGVTWSTLKNGARRGPFCGHVVYLETHFSLYRFGTLGSYELNLHNAMCTINTVKHCHLLCMCFTCISVAAILFRPAGAAVIHLLYKSPRPRRVGRLSLVGLYGHLPITSGAPRDLIVVPKDTSSLAPLVFFLFFWRPNLFLAHFLICTMDGNTKTLFGPF